MSNVTLDEVIDLTADAFGISRKELRNAHKPKRVSWKTYARYCAMMLALRHTQHGSWAIRTALGMTGGGSQARDLAMIVKRIEAEIAESRTLASVIEGIERRIEIVHEARVDEAAMRGLLERTKPRKPTVSDLSR